jgi:hypothetical protein
VTEDFLKTFLILVKEVVRNPSDLILAALRAAGLLG